MVLKTKNRVYSVEQGDLKMGKARGFYKEAFYYSFYNAFLKKER